MKAEYKLYIVILASVTSFKYLGVHISSKLSWYTHANHCQDGYSLTQLDSEKLQLLSACIREQCYKTLVRPQLEFASSVWDNTVKRIIMKVEAVHQSAARFTCYDYRCTTSVTTMLQKLQWDTLQCRARSCVLMLYRVRNELVAIPASIYLQPTVVHTRGFETSWTDLVQHKHV